MFHRCDHGNIYCAGECSLIRRRESLRRAQARYQHSRRGRFGTPRANGLGASDANKQ